jgi:tetratricopeptide (TPR) repeat protein
MKQSTRSALLVVVLLLFVPVFALQSWINKVRPKIQGNARHMRDVSGKLPLEYSLGAMMGFRQAVAGLLWVRTDTFFHNGDYDAIVPMIRLITWLDPQNTDVYETGAWHLDYNFTDTDQRSDRRYLPLSVSLLKEAIENNPTTTRLYADLAFTHYYRKMANFQEAAKWYKAGQDVMDIDPNPYAPISVDPATGKKDQYVIDPYTKRPRSLADPTIVGHGLAHALEAAGDIDGAIKQWNFCIAEHDRLAADDPSQATQETINKTVAEKNLHEMLLRKLVRPKDIQPPYDLKLNVTLERKAPRDFMIRGTANIIGSKDFNLEKNTKTWVPTDGARINVRLEDADYVQPKEIPFDLAVKLPHKVTIMQDSISITKGAFHREINMTPDSIGETAMYPFKAKRYKVTFWLNPSDPIFPQFARSLWMAWRRNYGQPLPGRERQSARSASRSR